MDCVDCDMSSKIVENTSPRAYVYLSGKPHALKNNNCEKFQEEIEASETIKEESQSITEEQVCTRSPDNIPKIHTYLRHKSIPHVLDQPPKRTGDNSINIEKISEVQVSDDWGEVINDEQLMPGAMNTRKRYLITSLMTFAVICFIVGALFGLRVFLSHEQKQKHDREIFEWETNN